jgi:glycosyltransferase involved in cell wall biosynthesis
MDGQEFMMTVASSAGRRTRECPERDVVAVIVISDLEFGGAQRQVVELANRLEAQNVKAYLCSLSPYVPLSKLLKRPEQLHVIPRTVRFDVTVVFRLASFLRKVRADVVHAFLYDAEIASRLAGLLARRPAVVGSERNADYRPKAKDLLVQRLTRSCQDLVLANSEAGAAFNSSVIGYPRSRYRVIRNGVDVERFRPRSSQPMKDSLGIPRDARVIGMFASFKPQKNHGLLLDAASEILAKVNDVRFLFVGDALYRGMSDSDTYKKSLLERVAKLGICDYCIFAGNRSDVEQIYPVCDLTVLPSLFEGTPNVLLESMACGVPVVATDVSDNRAIVRDGEVGFVVPSRDGRQLTDRVVALLKNTSLRDRMSLHARDWAVESFSSDRLAEGTAAVYREAISLRLHRGDQ